MRALRRDIARVKASRQSFESLRSRADAPLDKPSPPVPRRAQLVTPSPRRARTVCLILNKSSLSSLVNSFTGSRSVAVSSLAAAAAALVAAPLPRPRVRVVHARRRRRHPARDGFPSSIVRRRRRRLRRRAHRALRSAEARIIIVVDVLSRGPTRSSRARWIRRADAREFARTRTVFPRTNLPSRSPRAPGARGCDVAGRAAASECVVVGARASPYSEASARRRAGRHASRTTRTRRGCGGGRARGRGGDGDATGCERGAPTRRR